MSLSKTLDCVLDNLFLAKPATYNINANLLAYLRFSLLIRKQHYVKSVRIRSYSGPYFPIFGLNTDQNNSEYEHFSLSVVR